jgi:hypothetical protein
MRDLNVGIIECDEQFFTSPRNRSGSSRATRLSLAMSGCTLRSQQRARAVISAVIGKRNGTYTQELAMDLRTRILNRPQITADCYAPYIGAIEAAFEMAVDFATITKKYPSDPNLPDAAHRYSPGHVSGVERTVIRGRPRSREYLNQPGGALQSQHSDGVPTIHAPDQRIQQKV